MLCLLIAEDQSWQKILIMAIRWIVINGKFIAVTIVFETVSNISKDIENLPVTFHYSFTFFFTNDYITTLQFSAVDSSYWHKNNSLTPISQPLTAVLHAVESHELAFFRESSLLPHKRTRARAFNLRSADIVLRARAIQISTWSDKLAERRRKAEFQIVGSFPAKSGGFKFGDRITWVVTSHRCLVGG